MRLVLITALLLSNVMGFSLRNLMESIERMIAAEKRKSRDEKAAEFRFDRGDCNWAIDRSQRQCHTGNTGQGLAGFPHWYPLDMAKEECRRTKLCESVSCGFPACVNHYKKEGKTVPNDSCCVLTRGTYPNPDANSYERCLVYDPDSCDGVKEELKTSCNWQKAIQGDHSVSTGTKLNNLPYTLGVAMKTCDLMGSRCNAISCECGRKFTSFFGSFSQRWVCPSPAFPPKANCYLYAGTSKKSQTGMVTYHRICYVSNGGWRVQTKEQPSQTPAWKPIPAPVAPPPPALPAKTAVASNGLPQGWKGYWRENYRVDRHGRRDGSYVGVVSGVAWRKPGNHWDTIISCSSKNSPANELQYPVLVYALKNCCPPKKTWKEAFQACLNTKAAEKFGRRLEAFPDMKLEENRSHMVLVQDE